MVIDHITATTPTLGELAGCSQQEKEHIQKIQEQLNQLNIQLDHYITNEHKLTLPHTQSEEALYFGRKTRAGLAFFPAWDYVSLMGSIVFDEETNTHSVRLHDPIKINQEE